MLAPLVILGIGLFLAGPILAIVALARSRRIGVLQDQVDLIQRRLARIESRLASALKHLEPSAEPAPRTAPATPAAPAERHRQADPAAAPPPSATLSRRPTC